MACVLFEKFPQLSKTIAWLPLAVTPTPVEPLPLAAGLWIKRDDWTAQLYGGNKVRKLEFLLAAARQKNARRLITVGAAGSHHALATTIYGRAAGFEVTLLLFPQPLTQHVRDIVLLDHAFGAELRYTSRMEMIPAALFSTMLRYWNDKPFVIPAGGSDAVGTLGYVNAALELARQIEKGELPSPETIVVAAGTLGTAAGLALGFAIAGVRTEIHAVRITSRIVTNERVLTRLVRATEHLLQRGGARIDVAERALSSVRLVHDYIGAGYGQPTVAGEQAAQDLAQHGIQLDPTYTAKAAGAFIAGMQTLPKPALFWQTLSAAEPVDRIVGGDVSALPEPFRNYLLAGEYAAR